MQTAQPKTSGPNRRTLGVHLNETADRLRRVEATARSAENQLRRYDGDRYFLEQKAVRTAEHARKVRNCTDEENEQCNALHRLRAVGRAIGKAFPSDEQKLKRKVRLSTQLRLYKHILRRWTKAGKPVDGVPIRREELEQLLERSIPTTMRYLADLRPFLAVKHGCRNHPARYRPNISVEDVLRLQRRAIGYRAA